MVNDRENVGSGGPGTLMGTHHQTGNWMFKRQVSSSLASIGEGGLCSGMASVLREEKAVVDTF